jgi:acyl-coenzyme A thioesterase PaaI-like protein
MLALPEDFKPHFRKSAVTDPWEPLYSRRRAGGIDLAFEVSLGHCNSRGFLHGGVLATLCDNTMGLSLALLLDNPKIYIVTVNLAVDYPGSAKLGEPVLIVPNVIRAGGHLGFCDAMVTSGTRPVARANATFSIRTVES